MKVIFNILIVDFVYIIIIYYTLNKHKMQLIKIIIFKIYRTIH